MKDKENRIEFKNKWEDLTVYDYQTIIEILESDMSYEAKQNELISVLSGLEYEDVLKLEIATYKRLLDNLDFLSTEIPSIKLGKTMNVAGIEYDVVKKLSEIKTGQYLDFQYLLKEEKDIWNLHRICGVFLLPKGLKYSDITDMEAHQTYLLNSLTVVQAYSVFFYLKSLSVRLLKASHKYLLKEKKIQEKKV